MEFVTTLDWGLLALIFGVALVYASVGHGGASGYLAVMSLAGFQPNVMATTALVMNVLVSSLALRAFWQAGFFQWSMVWPFILTSIPAAFLGGLLHVPDKLYYGLLACVLLWAAARLACQVFQKQATVVGLPTLKVMMLTGAILGFLSGVIGVGGGIFLSPLLLLLRWADVKQTAAASAGFILVNALAGLLGRYARDALVFDNNWALIIAALCGGGIGATLGANQLQRVALRHVLAIVLVIAACKLIVYAIVL